MIMLTQEEANKRLDSNDNLAVIVEKRGVGNHTGLSRRHVGDVKSVEEKELIANLAVENKANGITYKATGEMLGLQGATIGDYVSGAYNSSPVKNDEKSIRKPEKREERVSSIAVDKLMQAMDQISNEKLEKSSANDLASVAVKMATVNEKIKGNNTVGNQVVVNVYIPKLLKESHFDVIDV